MKTKAKKISIEMIIIFALDWAYKAKKQEFFDGNSIIHDPKLKKGNLLLVGNLPDFKLRKYLEEGIKVKTCHTMAIKDQRDKMGLIKPTHYKSKGHMIDCQVIYYLYQEKPKLFYDAKPNEYKIFFRNFMQIQRTRVAMGLRAWAKEGKEATNATVEKMKEAEKEAVKAMDKFARDDIVYQYLRSIKGIGPRTGGGIRALVDATKFPTPSKLRKYCGLAGSKDGKIQKLRAGESGGFPPELKALLTKRVGDGIIKTSGKRKGQAVAYPSEYFIDYAIEKERLHKRRLGDERFFAVKRDAKEYVIGDLLEEDVGEFKSGLLVHKNTYPRILAQLKKDGKDTVLMELSDGHIHSRAIRKMVVLLMEDVWVVSRQLEGFSSIPPYATTVGGHADYRKPRYIPKILEPFEPTRDWGWIFKTGRRPWKDACEYIKSKCGEKI